MEELIGTINLNWKIYDPVKKLVFKDSFINDNILCHDKKVL